MQVLGQYLRTHLSIPAATDRHCSCLCLSDDWFLSISVLVSSAATDMDCSRLCLSADGFLSMFVLVSSAATDRHCSRLCLYADGLLSISVLVFSISCYRHALFMSVFVCWRVPLDFSAGVLYQLLQTGTVHVCVSMLTGSSRFQCWCPLLLQTGTVHVCVCMLTGSSRFQCWCPLSAATDRRFSRPRNAPIPHYRTTCGLRCFAWRKNRNKYARKWYNPI